MAHLSCGVSQPSNQNTPGACLVWIHYLPHFKTIPEPPPDNAADALLRPRDYLNFAGLRIAGYNTGRNALRPVRMQHSQTL